MKELSDKKLAIIGLGYVGLPLAVEFGKHFNTLGFDIHHARVEELRNGIDRTRETTKEEMLEAHRLHFSSNTESLNECNIFIVSVPTPIDAQKLPDFTPLIKASQTIGRALKQGDIVIYESTVYPGATEEVCVPVLEQTSGLKFNQDFFCGYSPERINPGDKERRLVNIPKITSGSTPEIALLVNALYKTIIIAGTHLAPSMKVAEAAKVIENTQRDANIALVNEFALIFHRLGIDTQAVLDAAGTKWNFLPFKPGLVGGHCIGVDPYYLIQKAQAAGYYPDILLACRRINDGMGQQVVAEIIKLMIGKSHAIKNSKVLILGLTFKENCPDLRNTRVVDLVAEFKSYGAVVDIYDPWADRAECQHEYGLELLSELPNSQYDAVVLAVSHDEFVALGAQGIKKLCAVNAVVYDVKGVLPLSIVDGRL